MYTISQLLNNKGSHVETVDGDATVYSALAVMADMGIGALVVMQSGKPTGLFSERDYARNIILKGRTSKETKVHEIMSTPVVVAHPEQSIEECMAIMTEKRVRHLPVMQGETLVGIISIGDLVKAIIENQQFVIEQLVSYING
ncbi:MAG: CBS domain-containing protein [Candidatus Thiodiazotropha sp. (ex Semelilucina semeliformis)]|nr:CBS domain-containing protein [Candidatus Thiodiazotropha sp. (ex Semelilucina semeliformis)]